MPKRQRLSRADFSKIAARGSRRLFGTYFSLSISSIHGNNSIDEPKFTCVVSKKVAGLAVDRNLIKRRCREVCRKLTASALFDLRGRTSLAFYAKKEAKGASYARLEADIRTLLAQMK